MKKSLLTAIAGLITILGIAQTTATDFTANDCSGASHSLFAELNTGKVIVITWVMPCSACVTGAKNAGTAVKSFATSNPGQVKTYIVDDTGNSICSDLTSWESTNSITTPDATFANTGNVIKMTDYGATGMPKIVVLGGPSHTVYYNVANAGSSSAIQTAINNALNALTSVADLSNQISSVTSYPNPSSALTSVSYSLESPGDVKIEIYNLIGKNIKTVFSGNEGIGDHKITFDSSSLDNGIYLVKIITGRTEKTIKLSVSH